MTATVVGLTGGIGSGKSTVAAMFARRGAEVVDTDVIARDLTGPEGQAMAALRVAFGDRIVAPDGSMDRAVMRQLAFSDHATRRRLEAILHPLIRDEALNACAVSAAPYAVLVVPLLVEAGNDYENYLARVAAVDCSEETQIARVMTRSGLSRDEAQRIMAAQASRHARRAIADDIIDNGDGLDALEAQVERLHAEYLKLAMSSGS